MAGQADPNTQLESALLEERIERLELLAKEVLTNVDTLTHAVVTLQRQLDFLATSNKKPSSTAGRKRNLKIVKNR
jgi:hypothetical protein